MPRSLREQSEATLKKHLKLNNNKRNVSNIGKTNYKEFTSIRSFKETAATLSRVAEKMGVERLKEIKPEDAIKYLNERREEMSKKDSFNHVKGRERGLVSQKTLDAERKALSILLKENITRFYSSSMSINSSRAYTNEQVKEIMSNQSEGNRISTRIALEAGLRASELGTIRRADELQISGNRNWHKDRFSGKQGQIYIVTGKGGLVREIILSNDTANLLESRRLTNPIEKTDRGVKYQVHYNIGSGNSFSQSFSAASNRAVSFSNGAHGLRHTYAQNRLNELKVAGFEEKEAKLILSQEIGHFRASITETYLR